LGLSSNRPSGKLVSAFSCQSLGQMSNAKVLRLTNIQSNEGILQSMPTDTSVKSVSYKNLKRIDYNAIMGHAFRQLSELDERPCCKRARVEVWTAGNDSASLRSKEREEISHIDARSFTVERSHGKSST
jgi:hypothetical protein